MTEYAFAPDWLLNSSSSGCLPLAEAIGGYVLVDQCTFPSVPSPIIEPTDPTIPIPPIDHGCYELSLTGSFHGPEDPLTGDGSVSISIAYPTGDICEPEIDIGIFVPCFVNISAITETTGEQRVAEEPTFGVTVLTGGWPVGSSSSGIACDFRLKFTLDMPCPIDFSPNLSSAEALGTTDDTFWDSPPTTMTAVRRWAHGQPVGRVLAWPGHRYPEESSSGLIETECFPRLELDLDLPCPAGGGHIASGDWATHWMFQSIFEQSDVDSLITIRQARYDNQYGVDASLHPHYVELPAGVIQLNRAVDDFTAWGSTGPVPAVQEKFRGWIDKNEFDENCELDLGLSLYIPCGMHGTDITFYESDNSTPAADWSAAVLQDWSDPFTEQECAFDYELRFYPPPPGGALNESLAMLVCAPGGESEYYDERYWAQFASIIAGTSEEAVSLDTDAYDVVTATNISESEFHTHGLRVGTPVQLEEREDVGSTTRWVFAKLPLTILVWVGGSFAAYGAAYANEIVSWQHGVWATYLSAYDGDTGYEDLIVTDEAVINDILYVSGSINIAGSNFVLAMWDPVNDEYIGANPTDTGDSFSNARILYSRHTYGLSSSSLEPEATGFGDNLFIAVNTSIGAPGPELYRVDVHGPLGGYAYAFQNPANWYSTGWKSSAWTQSYTANMLYACTINGEEFLYAAITGPPNGNCIVKWKEGQSWTRVGNGLNYTETAPALSIAYDMIQHEDDRCLYVVGFFDASSGVPIGGRYIAKWDGSVWTGLDYEGDPNSNRVGADLAAVESFNGRIWVGRRQAGSSEIDGTEATVLYYENDVWTAFDPRLGSYYCPAAADCYESGGSVRSLRTHANMLVVGGRFDHIKIGATGDYSGPVIWHAIATSEVTDPHSYPPLIYMLGGGKIYASKVFNGKLYVGGDFDVVAGVPAVRHRNIAAYDLVTHTLEQVGNGVTGVVRALEVYRGAYGTSSAGRDVLYIGGALSECDPGVQTGGSMVIRHFCFWDPVLEEFNIPGTAPGNTFNDEVLCMKQYTHAAATTDHERLAIGGRFDAIWGTYGYLNLASYDAYVDPASTSPWNVLNSYIFPDDGTSFVGAIDFADDYLYVTGNFLELGQSPVVLANSVARLDTLNTLQDDWLTLRDDTAGDPADENGITGRGYSLAIQPISPSSPTSYAVWVGCQPGSEAGKREQGRTAGLWFWTVDSRAVSDPDTDPQGVWDRLHFFNEDVNEVATWYGPTYALAYTSVEGSAGKLYAGLNVTGACAGVEPDYGNIHYVAELIATPPCWDKLGTADDGHLDASIRTLSVFESATPSEREVWAGGEFTYVSVDSSAVIHRPAEAIVGITAEDEWFDISGGCGVYGPGVTIGAYGPHRMRSLFYGVDEQGNYTEDCRRLFVNGAIGTVAKGYSQLALGLDARQYIPLQGGLWPAREWNIMSVVSDFRIGGENNDEICVVGQFGGGWNRYIKTADLASGDVRDFCNTKHAILWDGTYWKKFKSGSTNLGAPKWGFTCAYYKASGEGEGQWYGSFVEGSISPLSHGVFYFDRTLDSWEKPLGSDPDDYPTDSPNCMLVYNGDLWVCGSMQSANYGGFFSLTTAIWNGTLWTNEESIPGWQPQGGYPQLNWMCLADIEDGNGQQIFMVKSSANTDEDSSDGSSVWRRTSSGGSWISIMGNVRPGGGPQLRGNPLRIAPFNWCGRDYLLICGQELEWYNPIGDVMRSPSTVLYDPVQSEFFPIEWPTAGGEPGLATCGMTSLGDCTQHLQRVLTGGSRDLVRLCSWNSVNILYAKAITEWRPADAWGESCPPGTWTPDACALHDLVQGGINGQVRHLYEQLFLPTRLDCG